jgi:hypothetical protein
VEIPSLPGSQFSIVKFLSGAKKLFVAARHGFSKLEMGRAIAQAVSGRLPTAAAGFKPGWARGIL